MRDVLWADKILVMENKHRSRILAAFPRAAHAAKLVVLDIPDDYKYMDPALIEILEREVEPIIQADAPRNTDADN